MHAGDSAISKEGSSGVNGFVLTRLGIKNTSTHPTSSTPCPIVSSAPPSDPRGHAEIPRAVDKPLLELPRARSAGEAMANAHAGYLGVKRDRAPTLGMRRRQARSARWAERILGAASAACCPRSCCHDTTVFRSLSSAGLVLLGNHEMDERTLRARVALALPILSTSSAALRDALDIPTHAMGVAPSTSSNHAGYYGLDCISSVAAPRRVPCCAAGDIRSWISKMVLSSDSHRQSPALSTGRSRTRGIDRAQARGSTNARVIVFLRALWIGLPSRVDSGKHEMMSTRCLHTPRTSPRAALAALLTRASVLEGDRKAPRHARLETMGAVPSVVFAVSAWVSTNANTSPQSNDIVCLRPNLHEAPSAYLLYPAEHAILVTFWASCRGASIYFSHPPQRMYALFACALSELLEGDHLCEHIPFPFHGTPTTSRAHALGSDGAQHQLPVRYSITPNMYIPSCSCARMLSSRRGPGLSCAAPPPGRPPRPPTENIMCIVAGGTITGPADWTASASSFKRCPLGSYCNGGHEPLEEPFTPDHFVDDRSGCVPNTIAIEYLSELSSQVLLPLLAAHRARWEVISVGAIQSTRCLDISGPWPRLRHLNLGSHCESSFTVLGFLDAPLLRTAILSFTRTPGLSFTPSGVTLPWTQLTSLTLRYIWPQDCFSVLEQTPNLTHCDLILNYKPHSGSIPPSPAVTLPHLQSLILTYYDDKPILDCLGTFIVPSLRSLNIIERFLGSESSDDSDPLHSLAAFMSKSGCTLQEVIISDRRTISGCAYRAAFPSIKFSFSGWYMGMEPDDTEDSGSSDNTSGFESE
ncbi:hypothetical protein C8R46DRAFT_1223497 [Mycena filopes]|nr:hypothetical protein C8R46DRAFT_1223497 [Mycena filopes]